jgi:tetratricopeptide (TPR) repeat protein
MAEAPTRKGQSDLARRGYSDEETEQIYELGRMFLDSGQLRKAEVIMHGLNEVAPGFSKAWLASAYLAIIGQDYDAAIASAQNAMRLEPDAVEAMLLLASCLLITGDFNSAGTYLGEVGERIEMGAVKNPNVVRLFKMQLARYQSR